MKIIIGLAFFTISGVAFATGAPFCVFSSGPPQCFYYDVNSCRSAAASLNGMCAPNNQPQQSQQPSQITVLQQSPTTVPRANIYNNLMDGVEQARKGSEERQQREEHEARMRLYEAQTNAALANTQRQAQPQGIELDLNDMTSAGLSNKCRAYLASTTGSVYANDELKQGIAMGYCIGYIRGIIAGRSVPDESEIPKSCPPTGTTMENYARAIVGALDAVPEAGTSPELTLALGAFARAYPCPR
jgi:hypothetical protein